MARGPKESSVEGYLVERVKRMRGRTIKLYMRGWPDRLVVLPGRLFFVETKRPKGGRYEPLQLRMHMVIRRLGHAVYVPNTKALVDLLLDHPARYPPVPTTH